jgi:hypothetical protein
MLFCISGKIVMVSPIASSFMIVVKSSVGLRGGNASMLTLMTHRCIDIQHKNAGD